MLEPKPGEGGGLDPNNPGAQQQQTDKNKLQQDQSRNDQQGDTDEGSSRQAPQ